MSSDYLTLLADLTAWAERTSSHYVVPPDVLVRARAALAAATDGPAVPKGREPTSVVGDPSDVDLLELMPQQFREDLATVSRMAAHGAGTGVTPGLFRVSLNTGALDYVRAVLARYGHQPAPPVEGEVASEARYLAKELRDQAYDMSPALELFGLVCRAADLLEQCHPAPVPVSERLPEPSTKVLAHYFNALGKGRTICAIWVPAKSRSNDLDSADDDFMEYNEEDDRFYWPEGWYEAIENWEDLGWVKVDEGEVIYWQPLPKWPALPLPAREVQP